MNAFSRISTVLLVPAIVAAGALAQLPQPPQPRPTPLAEPHVDGVLQKVHSFATREVGVPHPTSLAWSKRRDALVLTDAARPGARRAVLTNATDLGRFTGAAMARRAPRDVEGAGGHDLRGRAVHPDTGQVFTYDATTERLLGLRHGRVTTVYDARDLDVDDVRGVVIAPSNDPTDHTSELSVYVVDNGARGNFGEVVEATFATDLALVAAVTPSSVRTVETSSYSPPSPDPSGVAYLPGIDRLFIGDGEVDEMSIFRGVNLFTTTRAGAVTATGVSQPWSDEPVGVGYNPTNNHLFVTDDDLKDTFELVAGADGRFGTSDDTVTTFDVLGRGVRDPEGIDYDAANNALWYAGGEAADLHRVLAGTDGRFGTSDDVWAHWDAGVFGAQDPEGMAFDSVRGTALLLDDSSSKIYEFNRQAQLLNTIDLSGASMDAAAGLAVAPASNGSGARTYYVVARGQDNDSNPNENDGRLYEVTATLPPVGGGNQAPIVDAGADISVVLPDSASLDGTVSDDGQPANPGQVTSAWTKFSGPGDVTFGNAAAVDTTASFSAAGTYVLRLEATDGQLTTADTVTITVAPAGGAVTREVRAAAGSDDAEQTVSSGTTNLTSADLELTTDGNSVQVVGVRFPNLAVPRNAQIVRAYVQFTTDEVSSGSSSLTVRAEASDNAPAYAATSGNISSRATTAGVGWSPPDWPTVGTAGTAQRTPDLSAQVQAVVNRTGWASGNAMAFQVSGTGRRTARAVESGAATAPLLHVEYSSGTTPTNQAPTVNAGTDLTVQLPSQANLDGTVGDDGLPNPPGVLTTTWSRVSGPGTVTFGNANAVDTTASFSAAGSYVLRLTASDGDLSTTDDLTVTVQAASPNNQAPVVDAGTSGPVQLPGSASLDATVTDDGLPNPPGALSYTWTEDSGPGDVTFTNPNAVDTTASFSQAGTYVLRLTASDSALTGTDTVTVEVQPAAPGNQAPVVNAGPDLAVTLPAAATLDGSVSDDGQPSPPTVTTTWSRVSGAGTVTFGDAAAVDTTASFSEAGTYVLRLSASDGQLTTTDDVTVVVSAASGGGATTFEKRVTAGSDDAEQAVTGSNALTSSDLELTTDGTAQQVVGVRFTGVTVPQGASISTAWIQFRVDEVSSGASSMTVRAEAADNPPTYLATSGNVTSRATTAASVPWSPPDWPTVGAATTAQRTPNLATLVQAVVNRPGWQANSAMAFQFSGTGRRTAEAFEGGASFAPLLHVEYSGGATGPVNQPPTVDAGPNRGTTQPDAAALDGTVTDDGLPTGSSVSSTWSKVSGPGDVTFANASAVDTTATFSLAGTYVLRLTASDGQLSASDEMTVVAQPAGGGGTGSADLRVAAGSDDAEQSVRSGNTALSSSDLELTMDGNTQQVVGIRIANVPVPAGATITSAYLQFTTDEVSTGVANLAIKAENLDNAPTYTNTANAVTGRATTAASVPWAPADWTTVGQATAAQRTPDLSTLVQAVVSRAGWAPGNAVSFQVSGTGVRKAGAFESGAATSPLLHLEWTTG